MLGARPGQGHEAVGRAVGGAEGFQLFLHRLKLRVVLVRRVIAGHVGDRARVAEARERVDVAVGVVAREIAVPEPEDTVQAEQLPQTRLDPLLREPGVARRCEQAAFGGEQRARAVDLDRPAFEDEVHGLKRRVAEAVGVVEPARDLVIEGVAEFPAPAVKAEVEQQGLVLAHDRNRPVVARPGVVRGREAQHRPVPVHAAPGEEVRHMLAVLCIEAGDEHPLAPAHLARDLDEYGFDLFQARRPIAVRMRPGEHHAALRRPLRGQVLTAGRQGHGAIVRGGCGRRG